MSPISRNASNVRLSSIVILLLSYVFFFIRDRIPALPKDGTERFAL